MTNSRSCRVGNNLLNYNFTISKANVKYQSRYHPQRNALFHEMFGDVLSSPFRINKGFLRKCLASICSKSNSIMLSSIFLPSTKCFDSRIMHKKTCDSIIRNDWNWSWLTLWVAWRVWEDFITVQNIVIGIN